MSKFFKNLRKTLIKDGELIRYFKYAFGEIILTILGIILALQVHTWNQRRSDVNEIKGILGNLQDEFTQNKNNLTSTLHLIEESLTNAKFVIKLVGQPESDLRSYNLDSLLAVSLRYQQFSPSQDVISLIMESGKLKLIEDDAMKNALYSWASNATILDDRFESLKNGSSQFILYLTKHYSLKDFDYYTNERLLGRSNLTTNKFAIFQDIVFENLLDNEIYYLHEYAKTLRETSEIIDKILKYSQKYE